MALKSSPEIGDIRESHKTFFAQTTDFTARQKPICTFFFSFVWLSRLSKSQSDILNQQNE